LLAELFLPTVAKSSHRSHRHGQQSELRKLVPCWPFVAALPDVGFPLVALNKYESKQYKDAYQEYSRLLEATRRCAPAVQRRRRRVPGQEVSKKPSNIFSAASTAPDLKLQEHAYYNLGNSLFREGEEDPAQRRKQPIGSRPPNSLRPP